MSAAQMYNVSVMAATVITAVVMLSGIVLLARIVAEVLVEIPGRLRAGYPLSALVSFVALGLSSLGFLLEIMATLEHWQARDSCCQVLDATSDLARSVGQVVNGTPFGALEFSPLVAGWLCVGVALHVTSEVTRVAFDVPRLRDQQRRAQEILARLEGASEGPAERPRSVVKYR